MTKLFFLSGLLAAEAMAAPAGMQGPAPATPNIVGGTQAAPGEFPWMVRLTVQGATVWTCDGALYSPSLVLTAAHCVSGIYSPITATVGAVDLQDSNRITRTSDSLPVVASGYTSAFTGNDWALIHLSQPIYGVPLLQLPVNKSMQYGSFTIAGWGSTSEGGDQQRYLLKGNVDFVDDATCGAISGYGNVGTYPNSMICAGKADGSVDTCQGDSGGPLLKRDPYGEWVEVGITSWGKGCGHAGNPGVYTELSTYAADICAAAATLDQCPSTAANVVVVPDIRGLSPSEASAVFTTYGLHLGTVSKATDMTCNFIGDVIKEVPANGAVVSTGSAVNVIVGLAPRDLSVCP